MPNQKALKAGCLKAGGGLVFTLRDACIRGEAQHRLTSIGCQNEPPVAGWLDWYRRPVSRDFPDQEISPNTGHLRCQNYMRAPQAGQLHSYAVVRLALAIHNSVAASHVVVPHSNA